MSNLPVYFMSILRAPASVITRIEKIQNRFLWEGVSEERKYHLVRWDLVKTEKSRGGLGVLDLDLMNKALLSKWAWRYAIERGAWWRVLVECKCASRFQSGSLVGISVRWVSRCGNGLCKNVLYSGFSILSILAGGGFHFGMTFGFEG
ncbi:Putative ribonuclease H protein At1g65750 [Linum grandiflorum]